MDCQLGQKLATFSRGSPKVPLNYLGNPLLLFLSLGFFSCSPSGKKKENILIFTLDQLSFSIHIRVLKPNRTFFSEFIFLTDIQTM